MLWNVFCVLVRPSTTSVKKKVVLYTILYYSVAPSLPCMIISNYIILPIYFQFPYNEGLAGGGTSAVFNCGKNPAINRRAILSARREYITGHYCNLLPANFLRLPSTK